MFLKAINITLILFLSLSNLVAICPESKGRLGEVHLMLASCDSHECHRNESLYTCDKEICDHQSCNDLPVFTAFHIPPQVWFSAILQVIPNSVSNLFSLDRYATQILAFKGSAYPSPSTSAPITVLRI